jgi:hypothetical protein
LDTEAMNRDAVNDRIHVAAPIACDEDLHIVRFFQSVAQRLQVSLYTADMRRIVLADLNYSKSISHLTVSTLIGD